MPRGRRLPLTIVTALETAKNHAIPPTFAARTLGIRPGLAIQYYLGKTNRSAPYSEQKRIMEQTHGSVGRYQAQRALVRQSQFENMLFASYIITKLDGRSGVWLAKNIKVTTETANKYIKGRIIPREEKQPKIFQLLEATPEPRFSTLDEYVGYVMSTCIGDHSEGYE